MTVQLRPNTPTPQTHFSPPTCRPSTTTSAVQASAAHLSMSTPDIPRCHGVRPRCTTGDSRQKLDTIASRPANAPQNQSVPGIGTELGHTLLPSARQSSRFMQTSLVRPMRRRTTPTTSDSNASRPANATCQADCNTDSCVSSYNQQHVLLEFLKIRDFTSVPKKV